MLATVSKFVTAWGDFIIPDDVPVWAFRKDGWFDRRRKITESLQCYFKDMEERLRADLPILTWKQWNARS